MIAFYRWIQNFWSSVKARAAHPSERPYWEPEEYTKETYRDVEISFHIYSSKGSFHKHWMSELWLCNVSFRTPLNGYPVSRTMVSTTPWEAQGGARVWAISEINDLIRKNTKIAGLQANNCLQCKYHNFSAELSCAVNPYLEPGCKDWEARS